MPPYIQEGVEMRIESLPKYINAYVKFWRVNNRRLVVVVKGLPGSKKTLGVCKMLRRVKGTVLFAEPRRKLRHWLYERLADMGYDAFEFRAKDEFTACPLSKYKPIVREPMLEWIEYLKMCLGFKGKRKCPKPCPFYEQVQDLLAFKGDVIVSTHGLSFLILLLKDIDVLIYDEGEELISFLSGVEIPEDVVRTLERGDKVDRLIAKRIKDRLYYEAKAYYLPFHTIRVPCLVLLSATWVNPPFNYVFSSSDDVWEIVKRRAEIEPDLIINYLGKLTDDKINVWRYDVLSTILEVASKFNGTIGIVGRDKELSLIHI